MMYEIIKVLNNNTILAKKDNLEVIVMYKGIGFAKKTGDLLEIPSQAKKYFMQKNNSSQSRFDHIMEYIDPLYLEISDEILKIANDKFAKKGQKVDYSILLPLADHIFFTIKRMHENIMPSNPFIYDIQLLFPDEYDVALQAREVIKKHVSMTINNDEVGFITLHIHSAISSHKVGESMEATRTIHEQILQLQKDLNIEIDVQSISYVRLMNHIKFLIIRMNTDEKLQMDISEFTKEKFPFAYEQACRMCDALSKALKKELPETEVGYLALHLVRILSSTVYAGHS